MAIRSTNANRAAKAPRNTDGPGNSHLDYGPPKPFNQRDQIDAKREQWGDSPWYGRSGNPMPWSGPPGQERGQRAPFFTPDGNDPRNAGYWVTPPSAEEQAATDAASRQRYGAKRDLLYGDDDYMAAKNAGDLRGQIAAMQALKQRMERERWHSMGLRAPSEATQEDIDNAIRPRSPSGSSTNGPGRGGASGGRTGPASAMSAGGGSERTMESTIGRMPPEMLDRLRSMRGGGGFGPAKGGAPGGAMPGAGASTGQDAIGDVAVQSMDMTPELFDRLRGGLSEFGRGAGGAPGGDPIAEMQARGLRIGRMPMGPAPGFGRAGADSPMAPPRPSPMGADAARKLAQGMPAHLLQPGYKPGSRS